MTAAPDPQIEAAAPAPASTSTYTFVASQLRTQYLPGGNTSQIYQVTAIATLSGVYFFHNFTVKGYADAAGVANALNVIAHSIDVWSQEPGVVGMSAVQVIDSQDQFVNRFDVTVESTSGNSTTVIRVPYPGLNHPHDDTVAFVARVDAARAHLDAVENA